MKTKPGRKFLYVPIQQIDDYLDISNRELQEVDGSEIVVYMDDELVKGANAVLLILKSMGGVYKVISRILTILPTPWLNNLYAYIANNRYRWFGKRASCEVS